MTNKETQTLQTFRLAAILYADDNYNVKPQTIYRKIIESILLESDEKELTIHQIIDIAQNNFSIILLESEIQKIAENKKNQSFYINNRDQNCYLSLTQERKILIESKINDKNIMSFINLFINENPLLQEDINASEVLSRYVYNLFMNNMASSKRILAFKDKESIDELLKASTEKYSNQEKEIINSFLEWDKEGKDKAIYDIWSYGLEYCLISNNNGKDSLQLNNLTKKKIYLDSNIIYRALGLNGEDRKNRTETFLNKFKESNEGLFITKLTEKEFKDSIKHYIEKIERYNSPRINSSVYETFETQTGIFQYYNIWRLNKQNPTPKRLQAEILALYEEFISLYKVSIDQDKPFNDQDEKVIELIKIMSSDISKYKTSETPSSRGSSFIDAENILWIEGKRGTVNYSLFDTKYFFISTDQILRKWDYNRNIEKVPNVMLPSQWMGILLRYLDRTTDDYKSFVSFLNLRNNEKLIDSEKLFIIISAISEITEDIDNQRYLTRNFIENEFQEKYKNTKDEDLYEDVKIYAETELEKKMKEFERRTTELQENVASMSSELQLISTENIGKLENKDKEIEKIKKESTTTIENLKQIARDNYINPQIKQWRLTGYLYGLIGLLCFFFGILMLFFKNWEYNFIQNIAIWTDNLGTDLQKELAKGIIILVPTTCVCICLKTFYTRIITQQGEVQKRYDLEQNLPENLK